jgi:hypothetical protein
MTTHPHHAKIVEAIKALPAYNDPQTFFESELAECYSDEELVAEFGWNDEKPLTVKQAIKAVRERCEVRNDVFGWIIEEGEAERKAALEDWQSYREEQEKASLCGWLVERAFTFSDFEPDPNATDEENYKNEQGYYSWMGDMSAECGGKVTEDCGAKRSDIIRNGVRAGWSCEAGHEWISEEYKSDAERYAEFLADMEDA